MAVVTIEIPGAFEAALAELEIAGVDKGKLFLDAMLNYLANKSETFLEPGSTVDVSVRTARLEQRISDLEVDVSVRIVRLEQRISDLEDEREPEEPDVVGTLHIVTEFGQAFCGVAKKNIFPIEEVERLLEQSNKTSLCMVCGKLYGTSVIFREEK